MAVQSKTSPARQPLRQSLQSARCEQCGRELRYVPFALNNIMCRECYGLDRYRRNNAGNWTPEKSIESTLTDEEASTAS